MFDTIRRMLGLILAAAVVLGVIPLLPLVFGFYSATVRNGSSTQPAASATPTSSFISCTQIVTTGSDLRLKKGVPRSGKFFQCTNNWNTAVNITVKLINGNSVITSMPETASTAVGSGATSCIAATTVTPSGTAAGPNTVTYQAVASNSTDLDAVIYFTGSVEVVNGNTNPPFCTP